MFPESVRHQVSLTHAHRSRLIILTTLLITLCLFLASLPARAAIPAIERAALIAFYNSTNGDG